MSLISAVCLSLVGIVIVSVIVTIIFEAWWRSRSGLDG